MRHVQDESSTSDKGRAIRRILLCEDEPLIRMVAVDMLEMLDLQVVESGTIAEALAALSPEIDLLISDVSLPDGSGVDLAVKVREIRPDMPVVFATGHHMKAPLDNSVILGKPFDDTTLAQAIAALTKG